MVHSSSFSYNRTEIRDILLGAAHAFLRVSIACLLEGSVFGAKFIENHKYTLFYKTWAVLGKVRPARRADNLAAIY
jgi:hypothetical protein